MRVTFLGVGEACDPFNPNTSILIESSEGKSCQIMLDCGFTTPHEYFKVNQAPELLGALWVSHFHGDHFFGVPLLLLRFWEMGRKQPLIIAGQKGIQKNISQVMELAYPGFMKKMQYELNFIEFEPGAENNIAGFDFQAAENEHSKRNLSIRINKDKKSIFYSGDGRPTQDTEKLALGSDLIINESFWMDGDSFGHGSIVGSIDFAKKTGALRLALVHLSHIERKLKLKDIKAIIENEKDIQVFLPKTGSVMSV